MREKELRLALVCSGGISLAVTMHGVTKELWHATRASRAWHAGDALPQGVAGVYARLFDTIGRQRDLALRLIPDILSGTSAGGINAVFLAQALISGQSLDALTDLWLTGADSDVLIDPEARPWGRLAKVWAWPVVWLALRLPGNGLDDEALPPATRKEVRAKVSRLIRARWFAPPFSGIGFSRLLAGALDAMAASVREKPAPPLLPARHPLDLVVTATDLGGHAVAIALNSPETVSETEHRVSIAFHARAAEASGPPADLAPLPELVLAARATASFPGALPPLTFGEIDRLLAERQATWPGRDRFVRRVLPNHAQDRHGADEVALIDGAVLNNRPFAEAMAVLRDRPARREVDRRFVFIEPQPAAATAQHAPRTGFFSTIFASLSSIPREQPIRDSLESIIRQSHMRERLRGMIDTLRPDIEARVAHLFGHTLFFETPSRSRLTAWRAKAQAAATQGAGFAYHGYALVKRDAIVAELARTIVEAAPETGDIDRVCAALSRDLAARGLDRLVTDRGTASEEAIAFFRAHDIGFRIRRLKLLARRLTEDRALAGHGAGTDAARAIVYRAQGLYQDRESARGLGPDFPAEAARVHRDPAGVLDGLAALRNLGQIDLEVDAMIIEALGKLEKPLRRRFLHAYLGFPWYDIATLPLLDGEGVEPGALGEFDPIRIDRIAPEDATSIRAGGAAACLKGIAFSSFGAFFSRAFRENDYLWGRLHGAERVIDIIASSVEPPLPRATLRALKHDAFMAILAEEEPRLTADPALVPGLQREVAEAFSG